MAAVALLFTWPDCGGGGCTPLTAATGCGRGRFATAVNDRPDDGLRPRARALFTERVVLRLFNDLMLDADTGRREKPRLVLNQNF